MAGSPPGAPTCQGFPYRWCRLLMLLAGSPYESGFPYQWLPPSYDPRREPLRSDDEAHFCSRCTIPEVVGKIASVAVNYFVSKGYCLSEASLAFAEIIPREKR